MNVKTAGNRDELPEHQGFFGPKTKVYIAGPVSGIPNFNRAAFAQAECELRRIGYWVFTGPRYRNYDPEAPRKEHLCRGLMDLLLCDAVLALEDYEDSFARVEVELARALDMPVFYAAHGFCVWAAKRRKRSFTPSRFRPIDYRISGQEEKPPTQSLPPKKYQPANETEEDAFMEEFCYCCDRPMDNCEIFLSAETYNVDNAGYPEEWQYDIHDQPMCTEFKEVTSD